MVDSHLTAGYCAITGTYHSHHPPLLAAATTSSLPDYLFSLFLPDGLARPAYIDTSTGATISFADLCTLSLTAAHALSSIGLCHGHVVLLLSPNLLHFPALSLAVLALGAMLSTAKPLLSSNELARQVKDSEPFLVLTTGDLAAKLHSLPVRVILIEPFLAGLADVEPVANTVSPGIGSDDPALLFDSSGTTERSKGVVSTHGNVVAMAESLASVCGGNNVDVYGCVLPLFHMFRFSAFVLGTTSVGATAVMVPGRFEVEKVMAATEVVSSGGALRREHMEHFCMEHFCIAEGAHGALLHGLPSW